MPLLIIKKVGLHVHQKAGIEQELMILQGDFLTYNYQIQELEKRVKSLKQVSQPTNE